MENVMLLPVTNTLDKMYLYYKEKYVGVVYIGMGKIFLIRRGFETEFPSFQSLIDHIDKEDSQ